MLSLDDELSQLRVIASRLGRSREEDQVQEVILGISLYFRQMRETHERELTQLRDEIRILHGMLDQRAATEEPSLWRSFLRRRTELEERIREALDNTGTCEVVLIPVPSPLVTRSVSVEMESFLTEIRAASGGGLVNLWTAKLAVFLPGSPDSVKRLPETFKFNDESYYVRARSRQLVSNKGERGEEFLKRIDAIGKGPNAIG